MCIGRISPVDDAPLNATEFASAVVAITAAFGDPTRRDIYLFAHERDDGVTASEVADHVGLHPNVARHHLDKLAGTGHLEVAVERSENAGAGRPSKRYRVTEPNMTLEFPVGHNDMLVTLLSRALAMLPADQAEAMAEEVGEQYGRSMASAMGPDSENPRSFRAALHAVADALTSHGFAAHAEGQKGELRIVSEHCPFGGLAVEHPVICAVDRGMVRGMLGALYGETSTTIESSLPMGDDKCVQTIDL